MLKRFYTAIVHRRRAVLAAFVLAAVLSVFASRAVQVDYDINDYCLLYTSDAADE